MATSWLAPRYTVAVEPRPARMIMGRAPTKASATAVTTLVTPGPAVASTTPGAPVSCA